MFITEAPFQEPGMCALTMRHKDPEGFVQGPESQQGIVYISGTAVREMVREFGHATKEEHQAVKDELAAARAELEQAKAELKDAKEYVHAIDVLESEGFRSRRKPGPKVAV